MMNIFVAFYWPRKSWHQPSGSQKYREGLFLDSDAQSFDNGAKVRFGEASKLGHFIHTDVVYSVS